MSTGLQNERLGATLFGKTRRAVLGLLFGHVDEAFYLRQIARSSGVGLGALQRELRQLVAAGILRRTVRGSQVFFQAAPDCPVFAELRSLVVKTAGVADVLRAALAPLAERIRVALIFGSIARGGETRDSDIDLLVVGNLTFSDVVFALGVAEETLRREINPTVYPPKEFGSKAISTGGFLTGILADERVFLMGDERELAGLAEERVAE